jgi:sporulation protein YqfC
MTKLRGRMKHWFTKQFQLPEDVMLELPRITMVGQIHAYIENHRGLVAFTDKEIILKMHKGFVRIKGEKLVLKTMVKEEIIVEGNIHDIQFIDP